MDRLYIIGNGFDLHHEFKTKYSDFADHLNRNNPRLLDLVEQYFSTEKCDREGHPDLWSDFEENLAYLDTDGLLEYLKSYMPSCSSDESPNTFCVEAINIIEYLTGGLCDEFRRFVLSATSEIEIDIGSKKLRLQDDSMFLSFNYSDTLERYYSIKKSNITYIHGEAYDSSSQIILGHGVEPERFKIRPEEPPDGLSGEAYEAWCEYTPDNYNFFYEQGVEEVNGYYSRAFKNADKIIEENLGFFSSLISVKDVYILGHSISEVDIPYFEKILESLPSSCQWHVSFYGDDSPNMKEKIINIGVLPQLVNMIKLEDLQQG